MNFYRIQIVLFLVATASLLSFQNCSHKQISNISMASESENIVFCDEKTKRIHHEAFWLSKDSNNNLQLKKVPNLDDHNDKIGNFNIAMSMNYSEEGLNLSIRPENIVCKQSELEGKFYFDGGPFNYVIEKDKIKLRDPLIIKDSEFSSQKGGGIFIVISYYTPQKLNSDNHEFLTQKWYRDNQNIVKLLQ